VNKPPVLLPLGTREWVKATSGATQSESWVLPLRDAAGGGVVEQPLPQQDEVNAGMCISVESGLQP